MNNIFFIRALEDYKTLKLKDYITFWERTNLIGKSCTNLAAQGLPDSWEFKRNYI